MNTGSQPESKSETQPVKGAMIMAFIQIVECDTQDMDKVKGITKAWEDKTQGKRTAQRIMFCEDRDRSGHFYELVFFDSAESAQQNSDLPETQEFSKQLSGVLEGEPTFRNLEVIEEHELV
jgi:hypothetical protein